MERPPTGPRYPWENLSDAELLKLRFRDLRLRIGDSLIRPELDRLNADLLRRGIRFRPRIWLSTEWFSPDGVPGIAVPFYAAHPRLRRLERRLCGDVEGGSSEWRLRLLRHEAGHAIDTAYALRRRADWRRTFGPASKLYPRDYRVRPASRRYVLHLGHWYAQSHPTEDFAETFAVWLRPRSRWRREYRDWPTALAKLEYVDALMREVAGRPARNRDRSLVAPLAEHRRTLGEHYRRKAAGSRPTECRYDEWLRETFAERAERPQSQSAASFLRSHAPWLRYRLLQRTSAGTYLARHAIDTVRQRARELELVLPAGGRREAARRASHLIEHVVRDTLARNRETFQL